MSVLDVGTGTGLLAAPPRDCPVIPRVSPAVIQSGMIRARQRASRLAALRQAEMISRRRTRRDFLSIGLRPSPLSDLSGRLPNLTGSSNRRPLVRARDYPAGRRPRAIGSLANGSCQIGAGRPSRRALAHRYCGTPSRPVCHPTRSVRRSQGRFVDVEWHVELGIFSAYRAQARRAYGSHQFLVTMVQS